LVLIFQKLNFLDVNNRLACEYISERTFTELDESVK